jgi:hypothetical protein
MKIFLQKNHRIIFYGTWLLLTLLQARYTQLEYDEAYYWVYSHYLAWGYFDHPPMIALMIKAGYLLFHNELGVRLFSAIFSMLTLLVIEKLLGDKNPFLFYVIALSLAAYQLQGFIAVPDSPLLLFTALFFLAYRDFTVKQSWLNTFKLALVAILLLYSKYHGVLVILFTMLSNPSLFRKYKTWISGFLILIGLLPHLYWQYTHNWPSVEYQLIDRNSPVYNLSFTLEYILGQLFLPGPFTGFILLPAAFLYKTRSQMERAMFFTLAGFYLFFLVSTLKGRVEANWTDPVLIPLFVLSHQFITNRAKWKRPLLWQLPLILLLVFAARIVMIFDILPIPYLKTEYHSWAGWEDQLKKRTKGYPVVFVSSYQDASMYWFYSGQMTYYPPDYRSRKTNYNFWPIEDSLLGKPVYVMDIYKSDGYTDSIETPIGMIAYKYDSSFASFSKMHLNIQPEMAELKIKDSLHLTIRATMPDHYKKYISTHSDLKTKIVAGVFNEEGWLKDIDVPVTLLQLADSPQQVVLYPGMKDGKYYLIFSIKSDLNIAPHTSDRIKIKVE